MSQESTAAATPQIAKTSVSRAVRRMFGLGLETWEHLMLASLAFAALAAVAIGLSTYVVVKLQREAARNAAIALDEYKADAGRQIAQAEENAAGANERAAMLEREAASARLEQERLKAQLAWRVIPPAAAERLVGQLARKPGSANLQYVASDPEAHALAIQIGNLLGRAEWRVSIAGVTFPNVVIFGIFLPGTGGDVDALRAAFSAAAMEYSTQAIRGNSISFGSGSSMDGAAEIVVGSKRPPP